MSLASGYTGAAKRWMPDATKCRAEAIEEPATRGNCRRSAGILGPY